jgi:hypothetical protein
VAYTFGPFWYIFTLMITGPEFRLVLFFSSPKFLMYIARFPISVGEKRPWINISGRDIKHLHKAHLL